MTRRRVRVGSARIVAALACVAALLAVDAAVGASDAATGQQPIEQPIGPVGDEPGGAALSVVAQTASVAPDGAFVVFLDVAGAPTGGDVAVDIYDRITNRAELAQSTTDRPADALATFETIPVDGERAEQQVGFVIHLYDRGQSTPAGSGGWAWQLTEPGAYPVRIRLRDADGADVITLVTYLVRQPTPEATTTPARVALLATLGPGGAPDDPLDVAATRALIGVLAEHPDVPVTLAVDPDLLQRTAEASSSGADLVEDVAALAARDGVELLGSPFTALDPAALVRAGLDDVLAESAQLGRTATEALLGHPGTSTWWLDRPLDAAAASRLRELGVQHLVVPPTSVLGDAPLVPTPLVDVDASLTVLADAAPLLRAGDPVLAGHRWLGARVAQATIAGGDGSASVARIDPATVDLDVLDHVLTVLADQPDLVQTGTVSSLLDAIEPATTPIALRPSASPPLDAYVRARNRVLGLAASEGSMRAEPGPDDEARRIDLVATARAGLTDERRLEELGAIETSLRATFSSISTADAERVNLGARHATIPLPVTSTATEPLRVRILLSSSNRLELPKDDFEVVVEPGRTSVSLPVRIQTSGDIPLQVTVTTPDGGIVLAQTRYTVRSTAVSGVGILLTVGAAGFLALWWGRHIWRTRRDGRGRRSDRRVDDLVDDDLFVDDDVTVTAPTGSDRV